MLADMGLPPVAERLPSNPLVVTPHEQIGNYGGSWNMVVRNTPQSHVYELLQYETMLRFSPGGLDVLPNVAESWQVEDDAKVFTFHIREGIKWSDGMPMTADDVLFWYADVISNEALYPGFPSWLTAGGERPTVEKVDDYTVRFVFPVTAAFFERHMGRPFNESFLPRHYLEQFHADYADADELAQKVADSGFEDWTQLFLDKSDREISVDLPVLFAWDLVAQNEEGNTYQRNPYYWKVDTEGNQLPYIDTVTSDVVRELSVAQLKAFSGEAELQTFSVGQFPRDTLVLKQGREEGDHEVIDAPISESNVFILALNLTHKDPVLREIFGDSRFRKAMSHAIDRDEIRELIYLGQPKEIRQNVALPDSPHYHEGAAKAFVEYDPDTANALLDEMGLTERNSDGFRLRPDGDPISIALEVRARRDDFVDALELISGWWGDVGISASVKAEDDSLFSTRLNGNEQDANADFAGPGFLPVLNPGRQIPVSSDCRWAPLWGTWYATGGEAGEEPPDAVKTQLALYDELLTVAGADEQRNLWLQIMDIQAEELYHMGICDRAAVPIVVTNRMKNVPESGWDLDWDRGNIGTTNPCQYYKTDI
jgi:peptide/nickel transport system substrate-binding protein